jgi:magnesium transporter
LINHIGELFEINALILEDIVDTHQRPRLEEFDKNLFWVVKMLQFDKNEKRLESEQVSIVIGDKVLITFQEKEGDLFEPVRARLRNAKGKIRAKGADYLAYALVDTLVDNYIILGEHLAEKIEQMEAKVLKEQKPDTLQEINSLKQEVSFFRRTVRPLRESIIMLIKSEHNHVQKHVIPYLKDLLDLTNHVTEVTEVHAEMLNDQLNIFHMTVSYRLNEVIRVLTVFSVIFIPLTFLAGIYGTNFEYLPELSYRYSYFIFWAVMIVLAGGMLWYFKRKKWL